MSKKTNELINLYNYVDKEKGLVLPYPFQNYSVKQLVDLSNRIWIHDSNHGHSYDMIVNGEIITDDYESYYRSLLLYISFLGRSIVEYFKVQYEINLKEFDQSKVYQYVSYLVNGINNCIDENNKMNKNTYPIDVFDYLGKERKDLDAFNHELSGAIKLIIKQKQEEKDLTEPADKLLKVLEVPEAEVEARYDDFNETFIINPINIESWLDDRPFVKVKH